MQYPASSSTSRTAGGPREKDSSGRTVHEIHKELSRPQKVLTLGKGFIELDMRQGMIVGSAFLLSYLPYALMGWQLLRSMTFAVPLLALAVLVAWARPHGKYIESWAYDLLLSAVIPSRLVYRADHLAHPVSAEAPNPSEEASEQRGGRGLFGKRGRRATSGAKGGKRRRRASVRDSIQRRLPQQQIHNDMIRRDDGVWAMVLLAVPRHVSFHDPERAEKLRADIAEGSNQIDFPLQELTDMRPASLVAYAATVERRVAERAASNPALAQFAAQHKEFLERFASTRDTRDRRTYIVIPYDPTYERHRETARGYGRNAGRLATVTTAFARFFSPFKTASRKAQSLQQEADGVHDHLAERATAAKRAYSSYGVELEVLEGGELLRAVKDSACFDADAHDNPEGAPNPRVYTPITLDEGTWARISERGFDRALERSEQVRRGAPPAMGIGEISVAEPSAADKTAPGYAEIKHDRIWINDTVHTTLFIDVLPPKPYSGILDDLLNDVSGRIRISKHIRPKDLEEIENTLSARIQELEDSEDDSELGSNKNKRQRQMALDSNRHAHNQLTNDEERFYELSTYIHLEASSDSELDSLVSRVKRRISGWHGEATKAYLEMWQGYLSCLPLATDRLQRRYVSKNIMTDALSCLHTFGSTQVRQTGGVLVGEKLSGDATRPPVAASDKRSGARSSIGDKPGDGHVIVNSRHYDNPHWLITGITGSGKTHAGKGILTREFQNGKRVRGIDPVGDSGYRPVTEAVGGQEVLIGPGSPHHFNPCQMTKNYANLKLLEAAERLDEGPDRDRAIERAYAERLAGKKRFLTDLVSTQAANSDGSGALTSAHDGIVEMAWDMAYDSCGINDDPETHSLTPPTYQTFFECLRQLQESYSREVSEIRSKLHIWEKGALKDLFAHQSNIDLENPWLFFQLGLADQNREQAAVTAAVLDFLSGDISDRSNRDVVLVDELWRPLSYQGARGYMEEYWRTARSRRTQMMGISHSLTEFHSSNEGRAILDLSAIQLLMRQNQAHVIESMKREYSLDQRNAEDLQRLQRGVGYLRLSGDNQIRVYVACSEQEMELFDTSDVSEEDFEAEELGDYLDSGTILGEEAYANGGGTVEHADDTAAGHEDTVEVADGEPESTEPEVYDPPDGYETVSEHITDGDREAAVEEPQTAPQAPSQQPPPRLVALAGPEAPVAAFEAAGLLASRAAEHDRHVLLVDAEGAITERLLTMGAPDRCPQPDAEEGAIEPEAAAASVIHEGGTSLNVLQCPRSTALDPAALTGWATEDYDAVVVAATARTRYGKGWLLAADRVAVSSARSRTLESATRASEKARGQNGTVLAPMGRLKVAREYEGRDMVVLPATGSAAISAAREGSTFAFLEDEETRRSFSALLKKLLTPYEGADHHAPTHADPRPEEPAVQQTETERKAHHE